MHHDPSSLLREGRLAEAVREAAELVRDRPTDLTARNLYVQLLLFAGEYEKASTHLAVLASRDSSRAGLWATFGSAARALISRNEVLAGRALPVLREEHDQDLLETLSLIRHPSIASSGDSNPLEKGTRVPLRATVNGEETLDFLDLDERFENTLEFITLQGAYCWISWRSVATLEFEPPEDQYDLIWRKGLMTPHHGESETVLVPCLYPTSETGTDDSVRLGRATHFQPVNGHECGRGLRVFWDGQNELTMHELSHFSAGRATASPAS